MMEDNTQTYTIIVYDDGNEKYREYSNRWKIIKRTKGKCTIVNEKENITIPSISEWKLLEVN
jgi:hypothetical protein